MKIDPEYKFPFSISEDQYDTKEIAWAMMASISKDNKDAEHVKYIRKKYGYKANDTVWFTNVLDTPANLLTMLSIGSMYCNIFAEDRFKKGDKDNAHFRGAYTIGVDIDETNYASPRDFIERLTLKPTFWYTSYSHMADGKGPRFRMIYVFNQNLCVDPYTFKYMAHTLNTIIERDTNEIIHDKCNEKASQYFNGTNKLDKKVVYDCDITNIIYDKSDIWKDEDEFRNGLIPFLMNYCDYVTEDNDKTEGIHNVLHYYTGKKYNFNKKELRFMSADEIFSDIQEVTTEDKQKCSGLLVSVLKRYGFDGYDKVHKLVGWKYRLIFRKESDEWIDGVYQFVDENYFSLFYNPNTVTDGHHRRKTLYSRMCLRRLMCPDTYADELLYNAYIDVCKHFESTGITIESLVIKAESVMLQSEKRLESLWKDSIEKRKRKHPGVIIKRGLTHSREETVRKQKEVRWNLISKVYDENLSIDENLKLINDNLPFGTSRKTLLRVTEKSGKRQKRNVATDDQIRSLIDTNKSIRDNVQLLKNRGISVGKDRVGKILSSMK